MSNAECQMSNVNHQTSKLKAQKPDVESQKLVYLKFNIVCQSSTFKCKTSKVKHQNSKFKGQMSKRQSSNIKSLCTCNLTMAVKAAYLLCWCNRPSEIKHVSTLVHRGAGRFVNHAKRNRVIILSGNIQLNSCVKCGVYLTWSIHYLGWKIV